MNKPNISAICDAGPVIHLDELNCLELLCDFQEIILADAVWEEVKHHRPDALKKPDIHFMRVPQEYPEGELLRTMCRIFSLEAGEIEALAIIEKKPDALFLLTMLVHILLLTGWDLKFMGRLALLSEQYDESLCGQNKFYGYSRRYLQKAVCI
jgi:predicted nucleic acid-binding protein